jgi:hypothetical protein
LADDRALCKLQKQKSFRKPKSRKNFSMQDFFEVRLDLRRMAETGPWRNAFWRLMLRCAACVTGTP